MDILEQIQWWGKKGIFIEYITIDQIANGYGHEVAKGVMPAVTYTVNVIKDGDYLHEVSFDSLKEALEDGLQYAKAHFSHFNQTPYGGEKTLMKSLDVGTKFHVCNGSWDGEIVIKDGEKCILMKGDAPGNAFAIKSDYTLDINILRSF